MGLTRLGMVPVQLLKSSNVPRFQRPNSQSCTLISCIRGIHPLLSPDPPASLV